MNRANRSALLAFLCARLSDAPGGDATEALHAVIQLAADAFTDDEEWSLVPDPVAQTGPFTRAKFAEETLLQMATAWSSHPSYLPEWSQTP